MSEKMSKKQAPGFISRAMFWWMFPLYYWGCKRDLDDHDMVPAPKEYNSKVVGDLLERKWLEEEAAAKLSSKTPSLLKVIFKSFSRDLIRGSLFQSIHIAIRTVIPLIFAELLSFWSGSTSSRELAAWYAAALISLNLLASLSGHHAVLHGIQLGMKIRIALSTLMFRKIMRMDYVTLSETTAGKLVNIMSNDLQRFDRALLFVHFIWVIPFQTAAVFYFGYQQAGYAAVVGLVTVLLITCPFQGVLGKLNGKVRLRTAKKTDERILLMNEIINGIQVIKMYAWEVPFQKMVSERRRAELKEVNTTTLLAVVVIGFLVITERAAIFITILVLVLTDSPITARVIFPLLQFMSTLQFNFSYVLPMLISGMAECRVSLQRVQEFMLFKDRNDLSTSHPAAPLFRSLSNQPDKSGVLPLSYQHKSDAVANPLSTLERMRRSRRSLSCGGAAATLRGVCVTCGGGLVLADVSIMVPEGKLCAIIGAVGSGKSSILQVLLRELPTASGSVVVGGRVSFASQEPWLFASSVRDNILFGTPLDIAKYKELHKIQVCKACALDKDFKQLPYGDQTLVGERGATLSGGQRARVNLARAVYREADIYLLDDPLSAVDANVGHQIFEGCVNGYLRTRTRVLVTHQIHFLKAADIIVVMNEGKVQSTGIYQTLSTSDDLFKEILQSTEQGKNRDVECFTAANCEKESGRLLSQCVSTEELPEHNVQAMEAEQRQSGELLMKMISAYFSAGGSWCYVVWVMFLALLPMIAASAFDYFISFWTNQMSLFEDKFDHLDVNMGLEVHVGPLTTCQYMIILGLMVLCCFLLLMTRVHPFARLSSTASANLHDRMFTSMLTGVMRFFDTSSSGRILNRFTKDTGAVDEVLPQSLMQMIQIFICLGTVLMLNAITLYYTLIPSSVLVVIFVFTVRIFIQFSTGVKRIEGTSKSPVFSMVTSSLNGMTTIRSTNSQNRLIEEFDVLQDAHTAAYNSFLGGQCGFGFYLDILCISYLGIILYVFLYIDFGDVVTAGSVGLVVTQTSMLISMLQHGAKMLAAFVGQITSVERMLEYTAIETEDNLFKGDIPINPNWPSKGRIVFENVSLRYSPEKHPVLKKLNVTFESAWKVGIVGRTGAGKSSLISALFRFAYINGKITIDGVDTSLVAKQELRSKISIIPQEPVLFSATVRYNLDPFGNYSDEQLWRALEQVDMKLAVTSLDYKVTKGGTNFSLGQRQLLCLARALLKSNKILIMDEATANVDPQTDSFVQQTIRREFSSCTVLTIAHRLNTIMDSDRVLVMSAGEILEFDHPYILLSDADSHFSSMVQETGRNSSCNLYQIASDSYFQSYLKKVTN